MATEEFVVRMKCIPRMLSAIGGRTGGFASPEERNEVAQEVFSRVWSHLERFAGRATLESWVFRYCSLTLMDARRSRWKGDSEGFEERLEAREPGGLEGADALQVQTALAQLDSAVSTVIELKHYEDLSFEALSARLGISINTAKTRYYRGLAELRQKLQAGFALEPGTTGEERSAGQGPT